MSSWKNFISNRSRYSLTSFFSSWSNKNKNSWENLWEEDFISKAIWETEKKYDRSELIELSKRAVAKWSWRVVIDMSQNVNERTVSWTYVSKPTMSEASIILKKNEGSLIFWRKGILTDDQVRIIAKSREKVLDLSLFDITDYQLEILSHYIWEEIIFWFKKLTDRQAEIFSKYNVSTLNLSNVLRLSDYQLEKLLELKWKKINLRDFVPSRVQNTMLYRFQWRIINRAYAQWNEINQKIIDEQRELKRQREEKRKVRSVAYTSFQYA